MNTIYIIVKGGVVEEVRASNNDTHVIIIDRDVLDEGYQKRNDELLKGTKDLPKIEV
jgi:hypothetical protein